MLGSVTLQQRWFSQCPCWPPCVQVFLGLLGQCHRAIMLPDLLDFLFLSYRLPPLNQCVELPPLPLPSSLPIPTVIPATSLIQQFPDKDTLRSICWLTLTLKVNTNATLIFVMLLHLEKEKFLHQHWLSAFAFSCGH